ncbi:MAG: O-antigen ligase family protein [Methylococcaceae bacterium]|nr:O-antigen ligase family protein [Methylococcaceae bacterium]
MLAYIAYLPGFLAYVVAKRYALQCAFIWVYLPVLLLLPDYYYAMTPGLPDPTASQSAAFALFLVFVAQGAPGYRFSYADVAVAAYAFAVSFSEYLATDYAAAQNLVFFELTSVLFPYLLAKSLIEPFYLRYTFAKSIVLCSSVVVLLNLFENRFGYNLWTTYWGRWFFPGQNENWVTTFRYGIARAAGPYAHCLVAGIMLAAAYRLQRWLQWSGAWPLKVKGLAWLPLFTPARFFTLMMLLGIASTLAKGPWLASIVAAGIVFIGRSKRKAAALKIVLAILVLVGVPLLLALLDYASVGRGNAVDDTQETAAYRYELVSEYMDVASEQLWWGWGLMKWPQMPKFESIDNHFLLTYLNHGVIAVSLLLGIMVVMMARLLWHGMSQPEQGPRGSSLAFTLAAIYLMYFIAVATVAMMYQSCTLFFLLTGLTDAHLRRDVLDSRQFLLEMGHCVPDERKYKFRKVLQ